MVVSHRSAGRLDRFARGEFPVGVRTGTVVDSSRTGRALPFEVWYPADSRYAGRDLDVAAQDAFTALPDTPPRRQAAVRDATPAGGRFPLVLHSHSSYGHRRQSTFLVTHLASHGYVVAAADHIGNSAADWAVRAGAAPLTPDEGAAYIDRIIGDRVPDLRALLDELLGGELAARIDHERIALVGWSFGGWAVLAALESDDRFRSVVALAPAGSSKPLPEIIPARLTFRWRREVPALFLAAGRDRFTPLDGIEEIFSRAPSPKRMFVLHDADHGHFADEIEPGMTPAELAHDFTRGLSLAHLDATLKGREDADRFLAEEAVKALGERGIGAAEYRGEAVR